MRIRVAFGLAVICGIGFALVPGVSGRSWFWGLSGCVAGFVLGIVRPGRVAVPTLTAIFLVGVGHLGTHAQRLDRLVFIAAVPATLAIWGMHTWLWAGTRTDARDGSVIARAETARYRFRFALVLALLGFAAFAMKARTLGGVLLGTGGLALFWLWGAEALRLRELTTWLRSARMLDGEPPVRASMVDIGLGTEQWLIAERPDHPYRAGQSGTLLVFGALREGVHRLAMMSAARTLALVGVALLFAVLPAARKPSSNVGHPKVAAPAAPVKPGSTPSRLGWYPQPAPILADLTGDGIEDIIGLRWNWDHEESALSVVATNGESFETIWSTRSLPAKWYSKSIHLLRSGDSLFFTDSEGNLFVHELQTGKQVAWAAFDAPRDFCAAVDGTPRVWAEPLDHEYEDDKGTAITNAGERSTIKRPDYCKREWERKMCPSTDGAPCQPKDRPQSADKRIHSETVLEQGDIGLILGRKIKEPRRTDAVPSVFFGYDPSSKKERFETKLAFTDNDIHAEPDLETDLSSGRLYAYYQLKNGAWLLGARDAKTGEVLWHKNPPRAEHGTHFGSMKASTKRLYVRLNTRLEVLDATTGNSIGVVW